MKSPLKEKSYAFSIEIVNLYQFLQIEKKEYILGKQLLKSGTSIGALIREAKYGQSKADFINKMSIALKEANETDYWLDLLKTSNFIDEIQFNQLSIKCKELIGMLVATIKTSKINVKK